MEKYKFSKEESSTIVSAIVEGYRDYVKHRKTYHDKMAISSAFSWTRSNFIESAIAKRCTDIGYTSVYSKAGPWSYLQFVNDRTKRLFMVRHAGTIHPSNRAISLSSGEGGRATAYLGELAKINEHIDFPIQEQMRLEENEANELRPVSDVPTNQASTQLDLFTHKYSSFHILTYALDNEQQLAEVIHYLPDPVQHIAHPIEDITSYISGAVLSKEEREILDPDKVPGVIDLERLDLRGSDE